MVDDCVLDNWFCSEVLPLEPALLRYIRRNWRKADDVFDLMHDVYALALQGAKNGLPRHTRSYLFAIAKHHLIRQTRRMRIVSFELVADWEDMEQRQDISCTERHMIARDELRQVQAGMELLPPRCRQIVYLRKVEGLTTRETAQRLDVGVDAIEQQLTKGMRLLADFLYGDLETAPKPASSRTLRRRIGR